VGLRIAILGTRGVPNHYGLEKNKYYLLMARMEPENNIE
jgi:hypothetical protein